MLSVAFSFCHCVVQCPLLSGVFYIFLKGLIVFLSLNLLSGNILSECELLF